VNVPESAIEVARDIVAAKRHLLVSSFDLMILDVQLPENSQSNPTRDGGIKLLDELFSRDIYQVPREVVGLTAFDEAIADSSASFNEQLWTVIKYDISSDHWEEQLQRKVQYIRLAERSQSTPTEYRSLLGIVTALHKPELEAILDLPWNWKVVERANDPATYFEGSVYAAGSQHQVYAVAAPRMGMTASSIATMKLIEAFRPRFVGMGGILAGIRNQCEIGDVIAVDPSWDYGSGKRIATSSGSIFKPSPHQISIDPFLRSKLIQMAQDTQVADEIRRSWKRGYGGSVLRIHVGPVASGAAVSADASLLEEVQSQHRKLLGLEMESYGVLAAAAECTMPQPKAFCLKSVCDFGDNQKNDDGQLYAAYTSAQAIKIFVDRYLAK
jgi:nucleoside phosphorylase